MKKVLIGVGVVVVVGGGAYAIVPRTVLKDFFQTGDKPTEAQFGNMIDSSLNMQEDREMTGLKEYNPPKQYTVGDTAVAEPTIYQAKVLTHDQPESKLEAGQSATSTDAGTGTAGDGTSPPADGSKPEEAGGTSGGTI